jgi:hypothetical protein
LTAAHWLLPVLLAVSAGPAKSPRYTIETQDGIRTGCHLDSLDEAGISGTGGNAVFKYERFIELRREGRNLPPLLTRDYVLLTTDDRIPLDPLAGALLGDKRLTIWPAKSCLPVANTKGLNLNLLYVSAAIWSLPDGIDDADLFAAQLQSETRTRDVIHLKNGDRLEGTIANLSTRSGPSMTVGAKRIETPWAKLAGLAWNSERAVHPRPKKAYARAVLEGGARISFQELRLDAKTRQFTGKTLFGQTLEFPEENLLALDVRQDLAVDVSDLTPSRYEQRPYLGASWPLAKDAAISGQPLRLSNNTYERGIAVHAPCRVTYKLSGQFERFDAISGIDEASLRGRARIALELDGKRIELHDGKELTVKDAPVVVRQDVRGVRELTLIVEVGSFGDVEANVNWAKARLIKK